MSTAASPSPSPRVTPTRVVKWTLINSLFAITLYHAVNGHNGLGNVLIGFLIFQSAMCCIIWLGLAVRNRIETDILATSIARGRTVPAWVSHLVGTAFVGTLIWHGWWGCALMQLFNEIVEWFAFNAGPHQYVPMESGGRGRPSSIPPPPAARAAEAELRRAVNASIQREALEQHNSGRRLAMLPSQRELERRMAMNSPERQARTRQLIDDLTTPSEDELRRLRQTVVIRPEPEVEAEADEPRVTRIELD